MKRLWSYLSSLLPRFLKQWYYRGAAFFQHTSQRVFTLLRYFEVWRHIWQGWRGRTFDNIPVAIQRRAPKSDQIGKDWAVQLARLAWQYILQQSRDNSREDSHTDTTGRFRVATHRSYLCGKTSAETVSLFFNSLTRLPNKPHQMYRNRISEHNLKFLTPI